MEKQDPHIKYQFNRAQYVREKLRTLKLKANINQECDSYIKKNNEKFIIDYYPEKKLLLENNSINYNSAFYPVVNDPLLQPQIYTTTNCSSTYRDKHDNVNNEIKPINTYDICSNENGSLNDCCSLDKSISICHMNILKKLFPEKVIINKLQNINIEDNCSNSLLNHSNYDSLNGEFKEFEFNALSFDENSATLVDRSKPPISSANLQLDQKLKYKFNTKYELEYGNKVMRNHLSSNRPYTLYNPTLLRSIHRKLSEIAPTYETNQLNYDNFIHSNTNIMPDNVENINNILYSKFDESIMQNEIPYSTTDNETIVTMEESSPPQIKSILRKSSFKSNKKLSFSVEVQYIDAIINGDLETILELSPLISILNIKTVRDKTPLHYAVESKKFNVVKYFVDKGLDVNAQDIRGRTPLHIAAYNNDLNVIELLLYNGASPYIFSDFYDGFPSMVINEYLPNAVSCINIFEEYNNNLGVINEGIVYPICDWPGDVDDDLPLKEMSAIVIIERNQLLLAQKWKAIDKHAKKGYIPWQIVTLYPTRNHKSKYSKKDNIMNEIFKNNNTHSYQMEHNEKFTNCSTSCEE